MSAREARRVASLLVALVSLFGAACTSSTPFTLAASGPFADPAVVHPSLERVAILVTITNRAGDDLNVNPGDSWLEMPSIVSMPRIQRLPSPTQAW